MSENFAENAFLAHLMYGPKGFFTEQKQFRLFKDGTIKDKSFGLLNNLLSAFATPDPPQQLLPNGEKPKEPEKLDANTHKPTQSPIPDKLLQGCTQDILQSGNFRQFQMACRSYPFLAVSAYEGIQEAMNHCRQELRFQTWDCSVSGTILHEPSILRYGYKESAYLWALSAAGASWGVASACAQGWLDECKCVESNANPDQQNWEWSGCTYGVQFGIVASRKLLTRTGNIKLPLKRLEKHNLKAGRLAVKKTLISSCKCHGVSGSCQQKTCWKKTADLREITRYLTEKYHKAKRVLSEDSKPKSADLIYLEPSPDICSSMHNHLQQRRSLPRVCNWRNETHSEGDCSRLCCGRDFRVSHEVLKYKCDCKLTRYFQLHCNECLSHVWISTCR
uniref:Protein Wnt n=1 Tax=Rhabditophanes sp. KR3021 TaxID=114890 RepID=A0AC35TIR4_9BILA